ncbi:hypothetical protein ACIA5D_04915 [Actinoplanes sp. NPDC051513]|uniref:hypothetical protein n=1 Tax=Actinoplanes sp. NPDC051513 TaxID=3363908 RepID=UPI0037976981
MTELLALHALVEAPPERVAEVLLDVRPGGRSPLAAGGEVAEAGEGDAFEVVKDGSRMTVTVDRARREVALQGEWWYRGVTSVEPDPRGSRVVHRIFNVAEGNGWAVRFVSRGPLNAAPRTFADAVRHIGETLGVAAWVIND